MYPMLEIKSVPIEIQVKTKNASLEYTRGTAEMEISRSDNGLDIKSRPIKLQLDTFESRAANLPRPVIPQAADGEQQVYEATASFAPQGQQLTLDAKLGQSAVRVPQAPEAQTAAPDTAPDTGLDITWEDGAMQIRYEMDKLNFDWKIDQGEFKFTPGDIEITVAQQPSINIKYLGGPIYVPPSSDPNYKAVDVKA